MAAISAASSAAQFAMQRRQANAQAAQARANAAATQAEIDRQTDMSRRLFDDRNTRLIEADAEQFRVARTERERRRTEQRSTESEVARIMRDAIATQGQIQDRTAVERNEAAGNYNDLLGRARKEQADLALAGDFAVDSTVRNLSFGASESARKDMAAKRISAIQRNIEGTEDSGAMGEVPAALKRSMRTETSDGVERARTAAAAGARVASYADSLRRTNDTLHDGSEDIAAIGRKANRNLKTLGAELRPFQIEFDGIEDLGDLDIAATLTRAEQDRALREERGQRVVEESADYETARSAIIDDYVTTLNGTSLSYEDALRRNGAIRLRGLPTSVPQSPLRGLFGAVGQATGRFATSGPSWGQVGSYLGLGARPTVATGGGSAYLPPSF